MKYIDADRLKAEIESIEEDARKVRVAKESTMNQKVGADGQVHLCQKLNLLINSLQEEQESVAERFARIVRGNLSGIDEKVQQEFEHLYFEITGNKMYGGYND